MKLRGDILYTAQSEGGLAIYDVSDPAHPMLVKRLLSEPSGPNYYFYNLEVEGDLLVALDTSALATVFVVDVHEPSSARVLGSLNLKYPAGEVKIVGNLACLADEKGSIVSLQDPAHPRVIASLGNGMTTLGASGGVFYPFFRVTPGTEFRAISVATPENPVTLASLATTNVAFYTTQTSIHHAFSVSESGVIWAFDFTNPTAPTVAGSWGDTASSLLDLVGEKLVVSTSTNSFVIYDISDPANGVVRSVFPAGGKVTAAALKGRYAFVATSGAGIQVYDLKAADENRIIAEVAPEGSVLDLELRDGYAYLAAGRAGLQILDVSDPGVPLPVSNLKFTGAAGGLHLEWPLAYLACGAAGLQILDLRNPANPLGIGAFMTAGNATDVVVRNGLAYVGIELQSSNNLSKAGLQVIDVGQLSRPISLGVQNGFGRYSSYSPAPNRVFLFGQHLYLHGSVSGYMIPFDVSNPSENGTSPNLSRYNYVAGDPFSRQIFATGLGGINFGVASVQPVGPLLDPQPLTPVGVLGQIIDAAFDAGRAYLADVGMGLRIFDVSSVTNAVYLGGFASGGNATAVRVSGKHAFMAASSAGMVVLEIPESGTQTIAWNLPESVIVTNGTVYLKSQTSAGFPITYSMVEGPAKLNGVGLTWTNTGRVVIHAVAGGSSIFPSISEDRAVEVLPVPEAKPALAIHHDADGFDVTWPAISAGYVLQRTPSLSSAMWGDLDLPVQEAGELRRVHIPGADTAGFYRLIRR